MRTNNGMRDESRGRSGRLVPSPPLTLWCTAVAVVMLTLPATALAQQTPGLREAVDYYHQHATSDLPRMQEATSRLEAVAVANAVTEDSEDGWLPAYWTALAYTQLSLFARDERSGPYVDLARIYFDRAEATKPDNDSRIEADFRALEGLLLGFESRRHPEEREEYSERSQEAWADARRLDGDNPMVWMNEGLGLLREEDTRARAYEILDRAIELYAERESPEPNWGREFIDVWMGNYPRPGGDPEPSGDATGSVDLTEAVDLSGLDPREWTIRVDREGAGDRPLVTATDGGLRVLTGGATILYPSMEAVSGAYRLSLDVSLFDPSGRNEGYGIVFGGEALGDDDLRYGYFLMRQDGMVLVKRRAGEATAVVRDWVGAPALRSWAHRDTGSDRVTNTLTVEAGEEWVRFIANGEEVHRLARDEIDVGGRVGLRVNHGVHIEVGRLLVEPLNGRG